MSFCGGLTPKHIYAVTLVSTVEAGQLSSGTYIESLTQNRPHRLSQVGGALVYNNF